MRLKRDELTCLAITLAYATVFTIIALRRSNQEFLLYAAVVLVVCVWVAWKQPVVRFGPVVLWGLSAWGLMHMAGGNVRIGKEVLYELQLVPRLLRYDQLVHAFGFGVATLVCHHLLSPLLAAPVQRRGMLAVLIVLMGCGVGALNEIIEFVAVLSFPDTGVGGYENTLMDLVFNLFGAIAATAWLALSGRLAPRLPSSD